MKMHMTCDYTQSMNLNSNILKFNAVQGFQEGEYQTLKFILHHTIPLTRFDMALPFQSTQQVISTKFQAFF